MVGNRPWVLRTQIPLVCLTYNACFSFFLSLRHPNNRFEHAAIFYMPLFNSVAKFYVGRKNIAGGGGGNSDTGLCHDCSLREAKMIMNSQLRNI